MKFILFISLFISIESYQFQNVVFIILSQSSSRHVEIADQTRANLISQLKEKGVEHPLIFDLHNDWNFHGSWTIFPLLDHLEKVSNQVRQTLI